jgi:hypothetical protein
MVLPAPEHAKLESNRETSITPDTHVPPSSNATLHDAGVAIQLDGEGTLHGLPFSLSPTNAEAVRKAMKDQVISVGPLPQALVAKTEARMGTEETPTFTLIKPAQKIVLTPTPTFVWSALSGAKTYLVSIYDEQDNLVLSSKPLYVTTWKPDTPLPRGKIYSWEVTANTEGKQIISSLKNFLVLTRNQFLRKTSCERYKSDALRRADNNLVSITDDNEAGPVEWMLFSFLPGFQCSVSERFGNSLGRSTPRRQRPMKF